MNKNNIVGVLYVNDEICIPDIKNIDSYRYELYNDHPLENINNYAFVEFPNVFLSNEKQKIVQFNGEHDYNTKSYIRITEEYIIEYKNSYTNKYSDDDYSYSSDDCDYNCTQERAINISCSDIRYTSTEFIDITNNENDNISSDLHEKMVENNIRIYKLPSGIHINDDIIVDNNNIIIYITINLLMNL